MQSQSSRPEAWTLLCQWTESASLRRHMLAVEAAMRVYAPRFGGDPDTRLRLRETGGAGRDDPEVGEQKLKTASFAAAVNREQLRRSAEALGVDWDEHLRIVIGALADRRQELAPAPAPGG